MLDHIDGNRKNVRACAAEDRNHHLTALQPCLVPCVATLRPPPRLLPHALTGSSPPARRRLPACLSRAPTRHLRAGCLRPTRVLAYAPVLPLFPPEIPSSGRVPRVRGVPLPRALRRGREERDDPFGAGDPVGHARGVLRRVAGWLAVELLFKEVLSELDWIEEGALESEC